MVINHELKIANAKLDETKGQIEAQRKNYDLKFKILNKRLNDALL